MDVLHLVGRSHRRGAELVALELAEALDERGHRNRVVAVELGHEGGRDPHVPALVATRGRRPGRTALATVRLAADLRRQPVDVVLVHGGTALQVVAALPGRRRPPVLWQRVLGFPPGLATSSLRRALWRRRVGRADGVVALTDAMEEEVLGLGFTGPTWTVPNVRREDRFVAVDRRRARAGLRAELGLAADVPLVGLVGHLVDQKDPVAAVDVLHLLVEHPTAHLVLAGDGPLRRTVEARIDTLGLGARCHLLGHRDDVEVVLSALDVAVLTSRDEGIPGVAVEAAMAGCPLVSYPLDGVRSVVDQGETGVVVDDRHPAALAAEVGDLLANAERRWAMGRAAVGRSGRFALATVVEQYEGHLAVAAEARRADRRR